MEIGARPHLLGALAATGATGLGVAVMAWAQAPSGYLAINLAALIIGLAILALLLRGGANVLRSAWLLPLSAAALLLTALLGQSIDGTARWVRIGAISIQPSLVLLPIMIMIFARSRSRAGLLAMVVTAVALAMQPDRAMAGALFASMAALALCVRERSARLALVAAAAAFATALLRPDTLPPTLFVEQLFADAFRMSVVAGLVLVAASAVLLLPMLALDRVGAAVFAALWVAMLLASVMGNYPTPLLGFGSSGILGYLLCLAALPGRQREAKGRSSKTAVPPNPDTGNRALVMP